MRRSTIVLTAGGLGLLALALGFSGANPSGGADWIASHPPQDGYQTRRLNTLTVWPWDISPDARHVTVIDWSTGDLALMDLVTGQVSRVTNKGSWEESDAFSGPGKFSPDGQRIAYGWVSEDCMRKANEDGNPSDALFMELRVIDRSGHGEPRTLLPCTRYRGLGQMFPAGWSPDGDRVLVGLNAPEGQARLATLDVRDGTLNEIGTVSDADAIRFPRFTPNGRYVVYSGPGPDGEGFDVFSLSVNGGRRQPLITRPGRDQVLGWEDGGEALLFQSEDGLSSGVFRLPVRDDVVPTGKPTMVRSGLWRVSSLGGTDRGFAYLATVGQSQVYTATLDLAARRLTSPPAPVEDPSLGVSRSGAWSVDGQWLAYVRARMGGRESRLIIRSVEGGETRELPFPLTGDGDLWWEPGGSRLLALGIHGDQGQGLYQIDLESGETVPVLTNDDGWLGRPSTASLSTDARTFVIARSAEDRDRVLAYDLTTGESREVPAVGSIPDHLFVITARVSPDGRTLAYTAGGEREEDVWTVPLSGGEAQRVYRGRQALSAVPGVPRGLSWTPDGSALLVVVTDFSSMTAQCQQGWDCTARRLLRIPMGGGEIEDLMDAPFANLRIHPDGSWITFPRGGWKGEVWLMSRGGATR